MYLLEGNIGPGKSTFLALVAENIPGISIEYEPVDDWQQNIQGESLLSNFYADPYRWAYTMETYAMLCRVRDYLIDQENPHKNLLIERSVYSGRYCFAVNDYQSGFISSLEWKMLCAWFDFLVPGKCRPPRGFIYLRVTPEVAFQRIIKRSRLAEVTISLDYLKKLHVLHDDFLLNKNDILEELKPVPVLVLDCNGDFEDD